VAEFVGSNKSRPDPVVQRRVEGFVLTRYAEGKSLREIAELTDRSYSAVRNMLDKHGVRRRPSGAGVVDDQSGPPLGTVR
jgi:DNA-binding NarL/FixJ family response regulator